MSKVRDLKRALLFELDNIQFVPKAIMMSPEFYNAINRPSELRGVPVIVNIGGSEKHWELKV